MCVSSLYRQFLSAAAIILAMSCAVLNVADAATEFLYVNVHEITRAPIGWLDFCATNPAECATTPTTPRDIVLTPTAFKDLARVNKWVNDTIKPMSDLEHWGVIERWSYPDDGYGDCEDYVLLKRRVLMQAGWPREALLITVVHDKKDEGHAVLTVKTDRGEFILDNQVEDILPWSETGYSFVKRQSQHNPNIWVSLGDPRPAPPTVAAQAAPISAARIENNRAKRTDYVPRLPAPRSVRAHQ